MKATRRPMLVLAAALAVVAGIVVPAPASADGGHRQVHPGAGHGRPTVAVPVHNRGYWGPRVGFGVYLGPGFWYPPYGYAYPPYAYSYPAYPYYPPYSYYPPVVTVPSSPPTYIERGAPAPAPEPSQSAYWYFCRDSNAYYPYVKQCPGGWEQQTPLPPPER